MDGRCRFEEMDIRQQSTKRIKLEVPGTSNTASCTVVSGAYKSSIDDNNLFSNIEKMRTAPRVSEIGYMPQAVPSLTHDPNYVDNSIQPSPKDSGIDISSPERKLDDLGDLSSQESSPRNQDRSLHLDADKGFPPKISPVYTDIRDSNQTATSGPYTAGGVDKKIMVHGALDSNMNPAIEVSADKYESVNNVFTELDPKELVFSSVLKQGISGHDSGNESGLDAHFPDLDLGTNMEKSQEQEVIDCLSSCLFHSTDNPVHSSSVADLPPDLSLPSSSSSQMLERSIPSLERFDCEDGGLLDEDDIINEDGTTLAELNMSQKSTEVDLQALLRKEMGESFYESTDQAGSLYDTEGSLNDQDELFATLNEDTGCPFTTSGTPSKRPYLTPTSTPNSSQKSPSAACSSSGSGFMAEFAKFLQKNNSGADECKTKEKSPQPKRRPRPQAAKQIKFTPKVNKKSFEKVEQVCPKKKISTDSIPKNSQADTSCWCPDSPTVSPVKRTHVKRLVKAERKLYTLQKKVTKLLKILFPELDYPSRSKTFCTVDVLLDQILNSVKNAQCSSKFEVICTSQDSILDVRISLCRSPQACIRHLRRKVCNVLEAILPDLHLTVSFDREGETVEDLVQEITQCNKS